MSNFDPTAQRKPVAITLDDLAAPDVSARVSQLQTAHAPQLTRTIGSAQPSTQASRLKRSALILGGLGLGGGLVGALLAELVTGGDTPRVTNPTTQTVMLTGCFALAVGLALLAWTGLNAGSRQRLGQDLGRGLPIVVVGGAAGGVVAQQIYYPLSRSARSQALEVAETYTEYNRMLSSALHVPRGIGFMIVGLLVGVGLGAAAKSVKRGQNAVIGGAFGGFIGGFLFDFIGDWMNTSSGTVPRIVALSFTGGLMGLAIGLIDDARRDLWLEIASGGMAGKQFIVWEESCSIGSGAANDITLIKDPMIAPSHATLRRVGGSISIEVVPGAPSIRVDGADVTSARISEGSMIELGQTVLRVGQRSAVLPTFNGA